MAKKFKRYFTGADKDTGSPGKGDDRRDAQISEERFAQNWCLVFGHRPAEEGYYCLDCGDYLRKKRN